jgi:hypothetical protein
VLRFGGEKALTKQVNDDALKCSLGVDDVKIVVSPKTVDHSIIIGTPKTLYQPKDKLKNELIEARATAKEDRLDKTASKIYDLEDNIGPEKPLNINFNLHQMEDY